MYSINITRYIEGLILKKKKVVLKGGKGAKINQTMSVRIILEGPEPSPPPPRPRGAGSECDSRLGFLVSPRVLADGALTL